MTSSDHRARLFLAFLILVLVLVNSQSLQISYQSRGVVTSLFDSRAREIALRIAAELSRNATEAPTVTTARLESVASARGLLSACLLDASGRLLTGGGCPPPEGGALDRLDEAGKQELVDTGWKMTDVAPKYDVARARAFGYLVVSSPSSGRNGDLLRIEMPAPELAETNRRFRTTLIYQVSALSLVLLAIVLFLNSLLVPQRKLVAEAQSVASELSADSPEVSNEGEFLLATFQDVVARLKAKERELKGMHQFEKTRADETEALASDIVRSMTTGLISLDPSGRVVVVNPAAEKIFGLDADGYRDREFEAVFPGSTELLQLVGDALAKGSYHLRGQTLYVREDGETLHLGVSVIPLLAIDGSARGALCLLANLTEVVELRERLLLGENLARLGEMAGGIAHEFRNGLATIMGNAKLLKSPETPEREDIVDALLDECHAMSRVVGEFLQFARPQALQLESVELDRLLSDLVDELSPHARGLGVTASFASLGEPCDPLQGDELLLRKAFTNLIDNAIDSAASTGRLDGVVAVELSRQNKAAIIRIRDNGAGVPAENRKRIFTPFFTGKPDGTGLGLSVVQKIVVSHDGTVELEAPEDGACFVVRLPLQRETRTAPAEVL